MENAIDLSGKSVTQVFEFIMSLQKAKINYSVFVVITPETPVNGQLKKFDQMSINFPEKKKVDKGPRRKYDDLIKNIRMVMNPTFTYLSRDIAQMLYEKYEIKGEWEREKFNATVASCLIQNELRYFEIDRTKGKAFIYKIKIRNNENA